MATINIRTVPDDLHRAFKVYAVAKGSNIKAEILRFMQEAIDKTSSKK